MAGITETEGKILLAIFKGIDDYYNANSLSKIIGISRIGAMKILRKFDKMGLLERKRIGKSITYKIRLNDDYARKLIAYLLADEANMQKRWKEEFKGLFKGERIVLLFGSILGNYGAARDIDIMIVMGESEIKDVNNALADRQTILSKKIHAIKLTSDDLHNSITKKDKAMIDIIKKSIVLYGQDKYVEVIKNVASA